MDEHGNSLNMGGRPAENSGGQTNLLALVSLVSGILGLTLFPVVGSLIALVTGYMARQEIRSGHGTFEQDRWALAGMLLGGVGVALTVISICVALAVLALVIAMSVVLPQLHFILPFGLV